MVINMCVWIEDADGIAMNDKSLNIVYVNDIVKSFLKSQKVLGISGIKGQGKTFLLKVKRSYAEKAESVLCFPKNLMVDQLDSSIKINKSIIKYMEDYTNWVSIWKIALAITIIKSDIIEKQIRQEIIENSPESIKSLFNIRNDNFRPSIYVNHLLKMKRAKLIESINYTSDLLEVLYSIHQAIYIFIDKIDQAFSVDIHRIFGDSNMSRGPRNASFWQYCQYALANASYDIYSNSNHHIKIYYSIRQEALIDTYLLAKNLKRNIESYITILEYSKDDLKSMFDMYVYNEEDENLNFSDLKKVNPVKAFLGIDKIENKFILAEENAFDYIYRHSLKRPSDIMKICKKLSLVIKRADIITVRNIVNECAGDILNMYISEISPFLPYDISELFFHINTNILNITFIKFICNRFTNQRKAEFVCTRDCVNCTIVHPFSVLYNIGLLGYIKHDVTNNCSIQSFNRIGGSVFLENIIQFPKSDYYFIHPCLMDVIRRRRDDCSLKHFTSSSVIIGDGYSLESLRDINQVNSMISNSHNQLKKENVFISSTIEDLTYERNIIRKILMKRGYATIMSEKSDFPIDAHILNFTHSHDYCLNTLMDCGSLISVIGKTYGGEYSGSYYKDEAKEIVELSNGKIEKPSISLMEYYLAVKRGLLHYVFINDDYDDKLLRDKEWDDRIVAEYKFISHLKIKGNIGDNWISRYSNMDDLEIRIANLVLP